MPIYEYRCKDCEQIFEEWQTNHEDRSVQCPVCGGESERIISNTSFVLKGTGWYVTDYSNGRTSQAPGKSGGSGNGNGNGNGSSGDSGGGDSAGKTEAPPSPAKDSSAKSTSSTAQS